MISQLTHTAKRSIRHIIAAGMTVLYLAVIFSPLATFALRSADAATAVARECSGDCNICGCSPQSRASQTCCCSRKRAQQARDHQDNHQDDHQGTADCCSKKSQQHAQLEKHDDDSAPDCCKKDAAPQKPVIIACGCPCGDGKESALSISSSSEALPYHFTESLSIPHTDTTFSTHTHRLTSRYGDPPDPPPQNS